MPTGRLTETRILIMRKHTFIAIATLLFWFTGTNHCALELLFSSFGHQTATTASHTPDGTSTDCPSHSENNSAQHQEGQPCGSSALTEVKSPVQSTFVFVSFEARPFELRDATNWDLKSSIVVPSSTLIPPPLHLLRSSIASNAPPLAI